MLHGRGPECAVVDDLLARARAGCAGALVVTGEAGMGKTALLAYAASRADGMRVLRLRGVRAESHLAFAGLHALLRPVLGHLPALPAPQQAALAGALGLVETARVDRFLASAGLVGLLSEAADEQPLLCLVDDAQWVDASSLDALAFAARRFEADRIALLAAVRTGERELPGLPGLPLGPLDPTAAGELLDQRAGAALDARVRGRVLEAAQGNPLALVELAAELAAAPPRAPAAASLPLSARLEAAFLRRARDLPGDARRLLLLAAADDSGDLGVLLAASRSLGLGPDALAAAERAGLLRVEGTGRFDFVHPLVRSAVYQTAAFPERQEAHRALAEVLGAAGDAARRAWHRGAAATFPDEDAAVDLERAAVEAAGRSGHAAAVPSYVRAAELTADPQRRCGLLATAAEAALEAGDPSHAAALVARAGPAPADPVLAARIDHVRGRLEANRGMVLDGYDILVAAAGRIAGLDPERAAAMLVLATRAASYAGDIERVVAAGRLAGELAHGGGGPPQALFVAGVAAVLAGDSARAAPLLAEATARAESGGDPELLLWAGTAAAYLGDDTAVVDLGRRAVAAARAAGALGTLTSALELMTVAELSTSPPAAEADATEGLRLARETDQPPSAAVHLSTLAAVAALRGDEDACRQAAREVADLSAKHGLRFAESRAQAALALLDLGLGRPDQALERLDALARPGGGAHPGVALSSAPDLVEAAVRSGRPERAGSGLAALDAWATSTGSRWVAALLARSRALTSAGRQASGYFEQALALHARSGRTTVEGARTRLLYGEFLRRERRRVEARPHLRQALETFERLGAVPWADRARSELRATGETARRRTPDATGRLTPQERQIARFVAAGATNKEVAAQLFLSPRTVDYHLRKVFTKLGVSSRAQLRDEDLTG